MTTRRRALVASLVLAFGCAAAGRADTDPAAYYREMQAKAPEVLEIQFVNITLAPTSPMGVSESTPAQPFGRSVDAQVKVLKVQRTATGLKPGQTIRVQYNSVPPPVGRPGMAAIPIFDNGAVRPAWMKSVGDGVYEPVAGAYSFAPVPKVIPDGLDGEN